MFLLSFVNVAILAAGLLAIAQLARRGAAPRTLAATAVTSLIVSAPLLLKLSEPRWRFSDYWKAYYPAGLTVVDNPAALAESFDKGVVGFVNLPILAFLFAPFSLMGEWAGVSIFTLIGLAATYASWALLVRLAELGQRERWLLFLVFATNGPLYNSIKEANTSHMVLLALVTGLYLLRSRRQALGGAALGFAALIKLPLLLLGLYFVLRGRWRAAAGFALVCVTVVFSSIVLFGWDTHVIWYEKCVQRYIGSAIGAANAQSVSAFLLRLEASPDILRSWQPVAPSMAVQVATKVAVALICLSVALACMKDVRWPRGHFNGGKERRQDLELSLVITLSIVGSPLSWTHYYCWLLIPLAFFLSQKPPLLTTHLDRRLAWIAALMITPAVTLVPKGDPAFMALYSKLLVSHYFFGALIVLGLLARARATIASPTHTLSEKERLTQRL